MFLFYSDDPFHGNDVTVELAVLLGKGVPAHRQSFNILCDVISMKMEHFRHADFGALFKRWVNNYLIFKIQEIVFLYISINTTNGFKKK